MFIHWFPGHMAKAKRLIQEKIVLVDVVVELLDARIPFSSSNPFLKEIVAGKPTVTLLNKSDLADPAITKAWVEWYKENGISALPFMATKKDDKEKLFKLIEDCAQETMKKWTAKGRLPRNPRVMIIGIPNVGKSTLINTLVGKSSLRTANRPGVTKGNQWIKLAKRIDLLDTPGILWPRFDDQDGAVFLSACSSVSQDAYDTYDVAVKLLKYLIENYPQLLEQRYGITVEPDMFAEKIIENVAIKRGMLQKSGHPNMDKGAEAILADFRKGVLGRLSLEKPGVSTAVTDKKEIDTAGGDENE